MASGEAFRASVSVGPNHADFSGKCLIAAWIDEIGELKATICGDVSPLRAAMMADGSVTAAVKSCEGILGSVPDAKGLIRLAAMGALDDYGNGIGVTDMIADGAIRKMAEELGIEVPRGES